MTDESARRPRWTKPPRCTTGEPFERWAHEMLRRGFTAWQVASKAGTSESRVTQAWNREEARRAERG